MSIDGRVASVWTRFALSSHDAPQNLNVVKIEPTRFSYRRYHPTPHLHEIGYLLYAHKNSECRHFLT